MACCLRLCIFVHLPKHYAPLCVSPKHYARRPVFLPLVLLLRLQLLASAEQAQYAIAIQGTDFLT